MAKFYLFEKILVGVIHVLCPGLGGIIDRRARSKARTGPATTWVLPRMPPRAWMFNGTAGTPRPSEAPNKKLASETCMMTVNVHPSRCWPGLGQSSSASACGPSALQRQRSRLPGGNAKFNIIVHLTSLLSMPVQHLSEARDQATTQTWAGDTP